MMVEQLTKKPASQKKGEAVRQMEETIEEEPFNIEENWTEEDFKSIEKE